MTVIRRTALIELELTSTTLNDDDQRHHLPRFLLKSKRKEAALRLRNRLLQSLLAFAVLFEVITNLSAFPPPLSSPGTSLLPNRCSQSQVRGAKMELRLDSMTNDIPYWCVFRAQTGISSAAMLTLFILFHRGNRVCVAHDARVPTCLDAEVLRGSASTHARPNLFSTFTCRFVTIEIQDSFTTVCLPGLKCALLYSQSIFFLGVARRNKNHSTPLVPSSPPHPCRLHSRRRTANSLSFHHLMIRRTPASQCHRRHHRY